jgi:endoglucanase
MANTGTGEHWGLRAVAALVLLTLSAGCGMAAAGLPSTGHPRPMSSAPPSSQDPSDPGTAGDDPSPAPPPETDDQQPFYVDPTSPAVQQESAWRSEGRIADADEIAKISREPQGIWLTSDQDAVEGEAHAIAVRAMAAQRTPVVVLYDLPHRDCDGYSKGGAPDAAAYRDWLAAVARGLGRSEPLVVLEPDGVASAVSGCLTEAQRRERYGLLAEAVTTLDTQDDAQVYLDAGNPGWVQDPGALASALRRSGVGDAAGFSLNVSNFYTTQQAIDYGHRITSRLGGAHFVVDTSRNGNGPIVANANDGETWCNPPGRALGSTPTVRTGDPVVDAFLWIKDPGESDGACRPGAPAAGQWWPDYALQLASASL